MKQLRIPISEKGDGFVARDGREFSSGNDNVEARGRSMDEALGSYLRTNRLVREIESDGERVVVLLLA